MRAPTTGLGTATNLKIDLGMKPEDITHAYLDDRSACAKKVLVGDLGLGSYTSGGPAAGPAL